MSKSLSTDLKKAIKKVNALSEEDKLELESKLSKYEKLISIMAQKYIRQRVEYEDLVQEALIGLLMAVKHFDPSRSSNFHNHAVVRMIGMMHKYCIDNESPIYVPAHIAKASSYVKKMKKLLMRSVSGLSEVEALEIIAHEEVPSSFKIDEKTLKTMQDLKNKMNNIAGHSKLSYERLASMAIDSISSIVPEDCIMNKSDGNKILSEVMFNKEIYDELQNILSEKEFTVLWLWSLDWSLKEIAGHLATLGYTNKQNQQVSRQAVKSILNNTIKSLKNNSFIKNIEELDK